MKILNTMNNTMIKSIETIKIINNIDIIITITNIIKNIKIMVKSNTLEHLKSIKNIMIIILLININKSIIINNIDIKIIMIENYEIHYYQLLFLFLHFHFLDITF